METINKVKEFHEKFRHPVNGQHSEISSDLRKLRIRLIFEELYELAEAGDLKDYFADLCEDNVKEWNAATWEEDGKGQVNRVEELDALADIRYVVDGAILALGFSEVFSKAFDLVHESNMSKLVPYYRLETEISSYKSKGFIVKTERVNSDWYIMTDAAGKVLKPSTYKAVDLSSLITKKGDVEPPILL